MAQNFRIEVAVGNKNLKTAFTKFPRNSHQASTGTNKFEDLQFCTKLKAGGRPKRAER